MLGQFISRMIICTPVWLLICWMFGISPTWFGFVGLYFLNLAITFFNQDEYFT